MKTIGKILKEARTKKRYSLSRIEEKSKIKKDFVDYLEREKWEQLPDYAVVSGFVKSLSHYLDLDEKQTLAFLRRDYPPKKVTMNPKPDVSSKFIWSPKLTYIVGTGIVIAGILGYLSYEYIRFISPPELTVTDPKNGEVVKQTSVKVDGKADADAVVKVNNQPVLTDEDGNFSTDINIYEGTTEIVIKAVSRSGKETVVKRNIKPEL